MRHAVVAIQNLLPQPHLARAFGRLSRCRWRWLKRLLIAAWMRRFRVSLREAKRTRAREYDSFEDFFTRELRGDARQQPADERLVTAPADGLLQSFGPIEAGKLIQAKGIGYPLGSLLGDFRLASRFDGGWYATIYLSPADYHRVHAPCDVTLQAFTTIPGQAFSVTEHTRRHLRGLYCRNERLVSLFDTRIGPLALVMVGAMLVTGIETAWRPRAPITRFETVRAAGAYRRGEELGRFTLGSTVVVLFPKGALRPGPHLRPNQLIRIGEPLGSCLAR